MSSVSTAVAQQKGTGVLATMEQHRAEFALVLPSHINAESWYASTRAALSRSADLMAAATSNPQSLIDALHDAARLGLQPGTEEYYLTPRKDRGQARILGISGYQGEVELIYRAGAVSAVKVELVRKNDVFRYSPGEHDRPQHEVDWFGDRGDVVGAYAYAVMKDSDATSKVVVVDQARIKRAKDASGTANASHSPWTTDYGAMVLKTAAHDLTKWVPTSAEYRREELRAVRDVAAELPAAHRSAGTATASTPAPTGGPAVAVVDGEVLEAPTDGPILPTGSQRMDQEQQKLLFELLRQANVGNGKAYVSNLIDRDVQSWAKVTADEANLCIANLRGILAGDDEAASSDEEPVDAEVVDAGQDGEQ